VKFGNTISKYLRCKHYIPRILQALLKTAPANAKPKLLKELAKPIQDKKKF
jgi:hypothetical protein